MNKREYLLTKLVEECLEVAQRATKAMCFGIDEVQSGQDLTNAERLNSEWNDLLATADLLAIEGGVSLYRDHRLIVRKREKMAKFMEYSRQQGCLVDETPSICRFNQTKESQDA